jgi:3-hydroxyisobutyrate dehydrogenase-like beta-hydroxyacid dehydrogenase
MMKVGFMGLGLMGNPMAKNIFKKGFNLKVYNRNPEKTLEFKKLGVTVAKNPSDLAIDCDIVVTMVTGPKDVKEILFGENGVVNGAKKGLIVIDMSTIGPTNAKEMALNLKKLGIEFIDAPVTGSVIKAESGELTIFIGGDEKIYPKAKPVLKAMGTDLQYMGGTGMGQAIKLINNHLVASSLTALAEAVILSDIQTLPRKKMAEALQNVFCMSPLMKMKLPNMVSERYETAFSMANMSKDEKLTVNEAKKSKRRLLMLELVKKLYAKGLKMGLNNEDNSAIMKVISQT